MSSKKDFLLRLLVACVFLSASLACNLSRAGTPAGPTLKPSEGMAAPQLTDFPQFSIFGDLATVLPDPVSAAVGPAASVVTLDGGASIQIPAGAFPTSNQLQVTRIDVAFDQIAPDVSAGKFYAVRARDDVPALGAPVTFQAPRTSPDVSLVWYTGVDWVSIPVAPGSVISLSIKHFSWSFFGFFEWWSEQDVALGETIDSMDNKGIVARTRSKIESADDNTREFFGVNEQASQTQAEMCADIQSVLQQYNNPSNRVFPADPGTYRDMKEFLQAGSAPSLTPGPFWKMTENSMETINDRVTATTGQLSPAELLKIAIDANHGNLPLGILAAHNYLKDITYLGRHAYKPGGAVPATYAEPASHLASWRQSDNITAAGEYDKMGPLYHIFAAMTGGLWLPTRAAGPGIAAAEEYLRTIRDGGDRPDTPKAAADDCGVEMSDWLRTNAPSTTTNIGTRQNQAAFQYPPTTEVDLNYQGENSARIYLDPGTNTWMCDDTNLFPYTFTLHLYPDESIVMDNAQLNGTSLPVRFQFQRDSETDWTFSGSDLTSADMQLSVPGGSSKDFDIVVLKDTLNEPNGNPGTCTYEFTMVPGSK